MVFKPTKLIENIFSMVLLRALEYILSFLLIPYLLIVLGPANMGSIVFAQSIMAYLVLISSYGFNLTAPRAIAKAEPIEYAQLFSKYMYGSIALGGIATFLLLISIFVCMQIGIEIDLVLYLAAYTAVIGNIIFPIWFFQGIQEMRYITILNLAGRLLCILGIFTLVKDPEDYRLAALLLSCAPCISGILSLILLTKRYNSLWTIPKWGEFIVIYKEGWLIFASTIVINLYTTTSIIILGLLTNNTVVGYYSAADKLLGSIRRMVMAVNDAVYPHINRLLKNSYVEGIKFLKKQLYIYTVVGFLGGLILVFWGDFIIISLLGEEYRESIILFKIMAFVPMIVAMSNVLGYETMLSLHMESIYSKILMIAACISLLIIVPLTYYYGGVGTAVTTIITEIFVTCTMAYVIYRKKIYKI
ncbi:flippase [Veillonella agrestimuris]|uniref:flippase n=1 Tax=Veillonella agrestimuris TaxID=2941340 RepID=UPI0020412716|nr:flippase [Veillonella agrestimuris]